MSQITGDLLIALSKQLPKVFSELKGDISWSVRSLEKEPTVDGEIYNIDVALLRWENAIIPFKLTTKDLEKWNHKLLTEHATKKGMTGSMTTNIDLYDSISIRIERYNSYQPFSVTRVEPSYLKDTSSNYKVMYISAGIGNNMASGYPEFDSRYEDLVDRVALEANHILREELDVNRYKNIKLEVLNNWLDDTTFDALEKSTSNYTSAIKSLNLAIDKVEEEIEFIDALKSREFVAKEKEANDLREQGHVVITHNELNRYLSLTSTYSDVLKIVLSLTDKVSRIKHNEAAQSVKLLSQTLVTTATAQVRELSIQNDSLADSVIAYTVVERSEIYRELMTQLSSRLNTLLTTLVTLLDSYQLFVKAGHDAA